MVAALHEYILEEVGNLLATEVLHKLLVAGMVIETETCIVGKNAEPISIVLLIYALIIRYAGLAFQSIEQGFNKLGLKFNEAAQVLGKSYFKALINVDLILLKPALYSAFTMVFLDIIKELPLSLLLRPFNFNTLATQVHQYASDEMLVESAFPTLIILILSFLMITLLVNPMRKENQ